MREANMSKRDVALDIVNSTTAILAKTYQNADWNATYLKDRVLQAKTEVAIAALKDVQTHLRMRLENGNH
jgi:hypothetical protein